MEQYHKIYNVFKRDEKTHTLIPNRYSCMEFEYLKNNMWTLTEKVDGTNVRIIIKDGLVMLRGKSDNAQLPKPLHAKLGEIFLLQSAALVSEFPNDACLYGEGYGGKIQSGGKYRADYSFVLFDVKIGDFWLGRQDVEGIADKFRLEVVPQIHTMSLVDAVEYVESGPKSRWGEFVMEGVVARPAVELRCRNGDRVITKIKYRDFV